MKTPKIKKRCMLLCVIAAIVFVTACLSFVITALTNTPHIHSITELNTEVHSIDSHERVTDRSTLELDYRTMQLLSPEELGTGTAHYPRLKKLSDGSYILFYNTGRTLPDVYYKKSKDLVNWSEAVPFCVSDGTYYYATCDAVVLSNGDILCCVAKRPVSWAAYSGVMDGSTLVTKRSTDNGETWSEESTVYTGMVWEPSLLELDSGEIQIYFTSTATYTDLYGYNYDVRSSGSSLIRSYDGGYTWTPNVTGHNVDPDDPYAAWRVMQQKIGTLTATNKYTGLTEEIDWMNDQMPVATQLNNGSIALVVESNLHFAPHPVNGGIFQLSIGYSHDNWATPLGRTEEGPADKLLNVDRGAGPYIRQFPSGEVIITHTDNTCKVEYKVADTTAHILSQDFKINTGTSNLWSSSEILDGHRIAFVSDDGNSPEDVEAQCMELACMELSLNHNITAYSQTTTLDGNSADWEENTEAIFIGSMSQAQCSVRSSYDSDNVYFLIEVLDDYLSSSDSVELRFALNTTSTTYYKIVGNQNGLVSENFPYSVEVKSYKNGTVDNDTDTDTGYILEIKLSKTDLKKIGFSSSLYIMPILYNTDGATTYDYDSISGADIKVKARTLCPMVSYDGLRKYEKIFVSSTGDNDACGNSESTPVLTLDRAAKILKGKGEIVVLDDISYTSDLYLETEAESIYIHGKTSSVTINASANIFSGSDLKIDNITINSKVSGKFIYMQYHNLYIGENVTCKKVLSTDTMLGITAGYFAYNDKYSYDELCSDKDCYIEINGGQWRYVRGGNRRYGTIAPLAHYSGDCTIVVNGGVFEATSSSLTDDVTSPTGMNSSSGVNTMIINGGRFVGAIYAQSRSGGITTSSDGFTSTPDYSGEARVIYTGGQVEKGIHSIQTIGFPSSDISYPYNTRVSLSYYNSLSEYINTDGFNSVEILAYAIKSDTEPSAVQLDGADAEFYLFGNKLFLPSTALGKVLTIFSDTGTYVYILDNTALTYMETTLGDAVPKYTGTAVRITDTAGLRFKSSVNFSKVTENFKITKAGSIVCFADNLTEPSDLTLDTKKIGSSIVYDPSALVEKWYAENDNGDKIYTAVLINFNENEYAKDVTYRPFVEFEYDGNSYVLYGECVTRSVYSVCKQCTGADSTAPFISQIITVCEGQDNDIDHSFFN